MYPNTNIMSIYTNITATSIDMAAYDLYILIHFFSQEPLSGPGTQVNSLSFLSNISVNISGDNYLLNPFYTNLFPL